MHPAAGGASLCYTANSSGRYSMYAHCTCPPAGGAALGPAPSGFLPILNPEDHDPPLVGAPVGPCAAPPPGGMAAFDYGDEDEDEYVPPPADATYLTPLTPGETGLFEKALADLERKRLSETYKHHNDEVLKSILGGGRKDRLVGDLLALMRSGESSELRIWDYVSVHVERERRYEDHVGSLSLGEYVNSLHLRTPASPHHPAVRFGHVEDMHFLVTRTDLRKRLADCFGPKFRVFNRVRNTDEHDGYTVYTNDIVLSFSRRDRA